jgi:quercetin dioxygenase-like cupin family protein
MNESLSQSLAHVALDEGLERLRVEAGLVPSGRASSTVAVESGAKFVLMAFRAGTELKEHAVPGALSIVLLEGRVIFSTPDQQRILEARDLLALPGRVPHALKALQASALLLTVFDAK